LAGEKTTPPEWIRCLKPFSLVPFEQENVTIESKRPLLVAIFAISLEYRAENQGIRVAAGGRGLRGNSSGSRPVALMTAANRGKLLA